MTQQTYAALCHQQMNSRDHFHKVNAIVTSTRGQTIKLTVNGRHSTASMDREVREQTKRSKQLLKDAAAECDSASEKIRKALVIFFLSGNTQAELRGVFCTFFLRDSTSTSREIYVCDARRLSSFLC